MSKFELKELKQIEVCTATCCAVNCGKGFEYCKGCGQQKSGLTKLEEAQKIIEINYHNAKVLLKVADNEIARLKTLVYCTCEKPNYNKFGLDNCCSKCGRVIENHPLNKEFP